MDQLNKNRRQVLHATRWSKVLKATSAIRLLGISVTFTEVNRQTILYMDINNGITVHVFKHTKEK